MHPSVNQLLLAFLGAADELIQWALKALPGAVPTQSFRRRLAQPPSGSSPGSLTTSISSSLCLNPA